MLNSLKFEVFDAHTHFFSYTWLQHFFELGRKRFSANQGVEDLARELGWELPPREPRELGRRWVEEQDKYGLRRQVLFASKLNDAEFLAAAVQAFSDRLIGYVMIDPTQANAREQTHYSLHILGMKGILMFPAMHHFHASDEAVYPVYEEAAFAEVPILIHFGLLKIPIFQKLGIPDHIDLSFSDPTDLRKAAADFPEVNYIVPHFGCGKFEQALAVARECRNIYFDTSSSNSWINPPLTLKEVFRKSIETLGAERIVFGTDSSAFPRGWRKDVFDRQLAILRELDVSDKERKWILGENIARLLALK